MADKPPTDSAVDKVVARLDLIYCEPGGDIVAQSDSWVLLQHLPAEGWNPVQQKLAILVGRAAYESGLLRKKTTLIASSRLPKNLESHAAWFDAIRTIGARLDPNSHALLTAFGMAADQYVKRIAALFAVDLIEARLSSIEQLPQQLEMGGKTNEIFFIHEQEPDSVDAQLIKLAHSVDALSVSQGGNVHRALLARLGCNSTGNTTQRHVQLLSNPAFTKPKTKTELLARGAIDWILLAVEDDLTEDDRAATQLRSIIPLESIDQSQYLLHWARRQSDAWPDQTKDAHLDQLIFGWAAQRHREVMTLCRIIASDRLIGSAHLTRAPTPVVCFTAVPLGELPERTVFRKHLARWDFVPYGLAIRKSVLHAAGCRAVIYGDESDWDRLSNDDRPWFQLRESKNGKIDWTSEQEWRLVGDLDLTKIDAKDAFAFVKTQTDAERLSEICRWPIVVLESKAKSS